MKISLSQTALILFSIASAAGCASVNIQRYDVSGNNIAELKSLHQPPVSQLRVGKFTSYEPENRSVPCRMYGPVQIPSGQSFESYIQNALISELKDAGLYSQNTQTELKGHLELVNLNTGEISGGSMVPGSAWWLIRMKFTMAGDDDSFTVENRYHFLPAFGADEACLQAAQLFVPAVQDVLRQLYNHPSFIKGIRTR